MPTNIIKAQYSSIILPDSSKIKRLPRAPKRKRAKDFWDNFDANTLVYDVFWRDNGEQILLICPPPLNLRQIWEKAEFIALPAKKTLKAKFYILRSTMTICLDNAPKGTTKIEINFNGEKYIAKVQKNLSDNFQNSRLMFTMSKNNPLIWIKEWARFHNIMHGVDSVIFFDNGSTIYETNEIEQTLADSGIKNILVLSLPFKYGPHDKSVIFYRFWANFLQISAISIMFRRFGARAYSILNCDIDELVTLQNENIFDKAKQSKDGLVVLKGVWVESIKNGENEPPIHSDFNYILRDFRKNLNADKWIIDPNREWLRDIKAHPGVHRIRNVDKKYAKRAPKAKFWHFKGINTNWKEIRKKTNIANTPFLHYRAKELEEMFVKYARKIRQNS